jgi:16S rRNA (uracil1498-N3)-methyltransferase
MKHRPHLLIENPWSGHDLAVPAETSRHLNKVLRFPMGGTLTYTDGEGSRGVGAWTGSHVERGHEEGVDRRQPVVTLAVAPPKSKDRQRSIVEKAQELDVERLVWLTTDHGQGRPANETKMSAWVRGALEQSRGAWLMEVERGATLADIPDAIVLDADAPTMLGAVDAQPEVTLAIGPEGGFSQAELNSASKLASLPANVLRTDTAAIVAVATVLSGQPEFGDT